MCGISSASTSLVPYPSMRRFVAHSLFSCGALFGLAACSSSPTSQPVPTKPAEALTHTLQIIRSATHAQPCVLKVLFYGQSITNPLWTEPATANLRAKYPNVVFEVRNAAIG